MSTQIQWRRGTTAQHSVFTGALGEVTVDTDKDTLVVHDNSTVGGFPLARESALNTHTARTDNPHGVTKTQVGLSNVDNTADVDKVVASAGKLTTSRTISLSGDATGNVSFDGSENVDVVVTVGNDTHTHAFGNITGTPTTLDGYGIADADTSAQVTTKINNAVSALVDSSPAVLDTLNELADALGDDPNFATTVATNIATKVTKNEDIVAGTGTKITYDIKGLVTGSTTPTTLSGYSIDDAYTKTELNSGQLDTRYYTESEVDAALALKVDDSEIASVNLLRADKYLASQNVVSMVYNEFGKLIKVQYNNATDTDYEVLTYNISNKLSNVAHYVASVLKGNTVLTYSSGKLISAPFVAV